MVETQFKSICRLNRLIILTLIVLTVEAQWGKTGWWVMAANGTLVALHGFFLMGNEFLLKLCKRVRDAQPQTITTLSTFVPGLLAAYIAVVFTITSSPALGMMGIFSVLQAQFLGKVRLSRLLIGVFALGVGASLILGYLHMPGRYLAHNLTLLLGGGGCLYYYGVMVQRLVRNNSNQLTNLQSLAATDALTGLTNRRLFNTRLHEEIARARRHNTPLTLALFDLDDFKRLNDFYGHQVGDRILQDLGKMIRNNIRESDLPARYGGEEFALILPETREAEAYELLERLRTMVAQTVFCLPENPLTITVSIGLCQMEPRQHNAFELVELADKALYEAKRQGKNLVVKGSQLTPKMLLSKTTPLELR